MTDDQDVELGEADTFTENYNLPMTFYIFCSTL